MSPPTAAFYFDLASPVAYLAAEQVLQALAGAPAPVEWQPVLASRLPAGDQPPALREDIERAARRLELQPVRWPVRFPFPSELAMRVATYAKSIGRTVPFAQAAFRQAFAGGRPLDELDNVLIAAAACEMHPRAVEQAAGLASISEELERATEAAVSEGVTSVPAIRIGELVWVGSEALREAVEQVGGGESEGVRGG